MSDFQSKKKLPVGAGWLIGGIICIFIWILCTFVLKEIGWLIGMILGLGSMFGIAIPIESIHHEPLTARQQKHNTFIAIILIFTFAIGLLFLIFRVICLNFY